MTLEQSIEEAQMLREYLLKVKDVTHHMPTFKESEVELRANAFRSMLLVLCSDVFTMISDWNEEKIGLDKGGER